MARFLLYKIGQFIANALPLQWAYTLAALLSDLQYTFSAEDRHNVRANIRVILNKDHIDERLVRDVFRNFGRYLVDFLRTVRHVDEHYLRTYIREDHKGFEYLREVLNRGKGAILVTAHIGNWELGGVAMAKLGFPILAVALPHKQKLVNDLFNSQREKSGVTIVPPNIAVRRCLEKLKANESIALVADRDFGPHGLPMTFLGRPAVLPKGPAVLSLKTGAGIIPTFLIRNPDNTFSMSFAKPVYPPFIDAQSIISDDVLRDLINQYLPAIEEKIRQYPSQWLMFRRFWIE